MSSRGNKPEEEVEKKNTFHSQHSKASKNSKASNNQNAKSNHNS
jgi:hypothetical protein